MALLLIAAAGASVPSAAQDATEAAEDEIEVTRTVRVPASTPELETEAEAEPTATEEAPDAPVAEGEIVPSDQHVIAQGLALYDEIDEGTWFLTELEVASEADATSETATDFGVLLQIEGVTIVRNDLTGKRARIEPGEGFYFSAGDPYTRYSEDGESRAWLLEIVDPDTDPEDRPGVVRFPQGEPEAFSLPDDIRDFEMSAGMLTSGESVQVSGGAVPTLVLLLTGSLQTSDGPVLRAPAPYLVSTEVTLTNEDGDDAQYYLLTLSDEAVGDAPAVTTDEDGDEETGEADAGTPTADTEDIDPDLDTDGDSVPDVTEIEIGSDPENFDTDGDGLYDGNEVGYTGVLVPDSDGDGYTDGDEELVYGTDPNDPNSYP
jgi:hypothetical protein